jgi:hypothetical protein
MSYIRVVAALLLPMGACCLAWAALILLSYGQILDYVLVLFVVTGMMLILFSAIYCFSS